jgi:hypothetical protein
MPPRSSAPSTPPAAIAMICTPGSEPVKNALLVSVQRVHNFARRNRVD